MNRVYPEFASELDAAERYTNDPRAALMYLRIVLERTVQRAFVQLARYPLPPDAALSNLMDDVRFIAVVPKEVLERMHDVRTSGNRAVHNEPVSPSDLRRARTSIDRILDWAAYCGFVDTHVPTIVSGPSASPRRSTPEPGVVILWVILYVVIGAPFIVFLFAAAGSYIAFFAHGTPFSAPIPTLGIVIGVAVAIAVPLFAWRFMDASSDG